MGIFNFNNFGLFLLIISILVPLYTNSLFSLFLKKKWKEADNYRKGLVVYDSDPFSQYFVYQQSYYDICINLICIFIFIIGLILIVF